jgi:hypothetical protein
MDGVDGGYAGADEKRTAAGERTADRRRSSISDAGSPSAVGEY